MKSLNHKLKKQLGFTLIELMIVVAIIGILAAIAIPNFLRFQAKAKQSEARVILSGIYTSETAYYAEQNTYQTDLGGRVGYQPASIPKYYARGVSPTNNNYNSYILAASSTSFSAQASGNIDTDTTIDIWDVTHLRREPSNSLNDVVS